MKDKYQRLVDETILHMTDSEDMEEALKWFEENRHTRNVPRTKELFEELHLSQLATLFKLKIDNGDIILENNKMRFAKQDNGEKKE